MQDIFAKTVFGVALGMIWMIPAWAQVRVHLDVAHTVYARSESVEALLTIHNTSSQSVTLRNRGSGANLSFDIQAVEGEKSLQGELVPPVAENRSSLVFSLAPGQILREKINLSSLFILNHNGEYRVKARVFLDTCRTYFNSPSVNFRIR